MIYIKLWAWDIPVPTGAYFTFYTGCPIKIRCDAGTENTTVTQIHGYFRQGEEFALIGKSTGNQVPVSIANFSIKSLIIFMGIEHLLVYEQLEIM